MLDLILQLSVICSDEEWAQQVKNSLRFLCQVEPQSGHSILCIRGQVLSLRLPQFPQLSNEYYIALHKNNVGVEK